MERKWLYVNFVIFLIACDSVFGSNTTTVIRNPILEGEFITPTHPKYRLRSIPDSIDLDTIVLVELYANSYCLTSSISLIDSNYDAANLEMGKCYDTPTQKFRAETSSYGDGYFKLRSLVTGKCLTVGIDTDGTDLPNDTPVYQFPCVDNSAAQAFEQQARWESWGGTVYYEVKTAAGSRCLSAGRGLGDGIYIYGCDWNYDNQWWAFIWKAQ